MPNAQLFGGALAALIEIGGKWPEKVGDSWLNDDERWALILEVANAAPDDDVIAMVGVGPVETASFTPRYRGTPGRHRGP